MYGKKSASTFRQLFGHQLRQIHGCSTAIAATLIDRFGTTARFMQEIDCMGQVRAEVSYIHVHTYTNIYVHTHLYMHTYIHTHIHTVTIYLACVFCCSICFQIW